MQKRTSEAAKPFRFTPGPPSREALKQYPVWCFALDEEEVPGQDESTVRPSDDQNRIDWGTSHAAATATAPDGRRFDAMLDAEGGGMFGVEDVGIATIWIDDEPVEVKLYSGKKIWTHGSPRSPLGYFNDGYLPLELRSVALAPQGAEPIVITLLANGRIDYAPRPEVIPALPPILRPRDIPEGDRSKLTQDERKVTIALGEKNTVVGRSREVWEVRGNEIHQREEYDNPGKARRLELVTRYDARTFQVLALEFTNGDKVKRYSKQDGEIPEAFLNTGLVLRTIPLHVGWSMRMPVFRMDDGRVDYGLYVVEGIEAAPPQPGTRAWRVRVEGRGTFYTIGWYDVETGKDLGSEMTSYVDGSRKLVIDESLMTTTEQ